MEEQLMEATQQNKNSVEEKTAEVEEELPLKSASQEEDVSHNEQLFGPDYNEEVFHILFLFSHF